RVPPGGRDRERQVVRVHGRELWAPLSAHPDSSLTLVVRIRGRTVLTDSRASSLIRRPRPPSGPARPASRAGARGGPAWWGGSAGSAGGPPRAAVSGSRRNR